MPRKPAEKDVIDADYGDRDSKAGPNPPPGQNKPGLGSIVIFNGYDKPAPAIVTGVTGFKTNLRIFKGSATIAYREGVEYGQSGDTWNWPPQATTLPVLPEPDQGLPEPK